MNKKVDYLIREKTTFTRKQSGDLQHILGNLLPVSNMSIDMLKIGLKEIDKLNVPYCKKAIEYGKYKKENPTTFFDLLERVEYVNKELQDIREYLEQFTTNK